MNAHFYAVNFRVHVSMRYHQARRAWWTALNRMSSIAAALAGSAAVITVSGADDTKGWAYIAAISGAFAALNAALGFTDRAREHATLYDKFCHVASKMAAEASPDDDAVACKYEADVLLIEGSEPPIIQSLNIYCHNQECEARDQLDHKRILHWYNRLLKSWGTVWDDFPPAK